MLTNANIKLIKSLHTKKGRNETGLFITEGDKICRELLQSNYKIKHVYALSEWTKLNNELIKSPSVIVEITKKELSRISGLKTPNQALIVAEIPKPKLSDIKISGNTCLVLETIQDAGNLGTIIRTADWFGVNNIICSPDTVELYNPKVVQASMGSITRMNVVYQDLSDFFKTLSSHTPVYGAFLDGENIYDLKPPKELVILLGNESKGISDNLSQFITKKTTIPSFSSLKNGQKAESLNASVAAAIYLSWCKV